MSMSDRDGKIWMDGVLVDWREAKIHVLTHTLHYGCGAFEGVPGLLHPAPPTPSRQVSCTHDARLAGQQTEKPPLGETPAAAFLTL